MAITVNPKNIQTTGIDWGKHDRETGVTTGNEFIFQVKPGSIIEISADATATGDASIKFSYSNDVPTAFTDFYQQSGGDSTDELRFATNGPSSIRWVGVDVTSGTWTFDIAVTEDVWKV